MAEAPRTLMPEPLMRCSTSNTSMEALVHAHGQGEARDRELWEPGQEWLLGCFLPPFQRPPVWDEARSVAFVESAWLGLHLGTYVVNKWDAFDERTQRFHGTDQWLVDGQQRLRAVRAYLDGAFPVFGHHWADLTTLDRRRFKAREFGCSTVRIADEASLRALYDRLNFGGVPHGEGQRASRAA